MILENTDAEKSYSGGSKLRRWGYRASGFTSCRPKEYKKHRRQADIREITSHLNYNALMLPVATTQGWEMEGRVISGEVKVRSDAMSGPSE